MKMLNILIAATAIAASGKPSITIDDFETGTTQKWEEKRFKDATEYTVINDSGNHALKAKSENAASGLVYKIEFEAADYPILSWKWKVENILSKGDASLKAGDDYAARVYVVFPHWFPPKTKSLNYIWANKLPKGERTPNPFFRNAVMIAVESGAENVGKWLKESRNLAEDFKEAFGFNPPKAGAVAIMTDTDQTGESATAYYDDIRLEAAP